MKLVDQTRNYSKSSICLELANLATLAQAHVAPRVAWTPAGLRYQPESAIVVGTSIVDRALGTKHSSIKHLNLPATGAFPADFKSDILPSTGREIWLARTEVQGTPG